MNMATFHFPLKNIGSEIKAKDILERAKEGDHWREQAIKNVTCFLMIVMLIVAAVLMSIALLMYAGHHLCEAKVCLGYKPHLTAETLNMIEAFIINGVTFGGGILFAKKAL